MNWDDVNVLRNLPDGWYSVPSNSKYGEMINKYPDVRYDDSVEKARERHDRILEREREMDDFIKSESLRDKSKICTHKNFYYKGYLICEVCGLAEQGFDPFDFSESDEIISRMCGKAKGIFRRLTDDLDIDQDIDSDELLRVYKTYVLTDNDRGNRNFRISARPEGLCAALLWRYLQMNKVFMTMLEFSERVKVDRTTISYIFKRLDDYKDFSVSKRGRRPKRK